MNDTTTQPRSNAASHDPVLRVAGWMLFTAAIVLTGILLTHVADRGENTANAEMVIDKNTYTVLTAPYNASTEYLYLLDSQTGSLMAYTKRLQNKEIERVDVLDVRGAFDKAMKMIKPAKR